MSETKRPISDGEASPPSKRPSGCEKRAYQSPELKQYGDISTITLNRANRPRLDGGRQAGSSTF